MKRNVKWVSIPIMIVCVVAVLGFAVMSLWNWVMPALFAGSRLIDYPHALGLLCLCRILFGGFRGGFHGRGGRNRHRRWERWAAMTSEERERVLQHRSAAL